MANQFNILSTKFYNQYRNDDGTLTFLLNLGEFTTQLQGNVGEICQLVQQAEIGTIINEYEVIPITFTDFTTYGMFEAASLNFINEGLYPGANLRIEFDTTEAINVTVQQVTGHNNSKFTISAADTTSMLATVLNSGDTRTDFVIKVTTAPKYLRYDFGINPNSYTGENYQSNIDSNIQTYYHPAVPTTPTYGSMTWTGSQIGANTGTVQVTFLATVDNYKHQYEIKHIFKLMPYYVEGQQSNLANSINPPDFIGSNSFRYDNKYQFGNNPLTAAIFPLQGLPGNVGYFNENFNGQTNPYSIENVVITNTSATGTLESTETNTVTFDIVSTAGNWTTLADRVILTHSKLPTASEYQNKTTSFDNNWLFENISNTADSGIVNGSILRNYAVSIDGGDPARLNVTVDVVFNALQRTLITDLSEYLLYVIVAHNNLNLPYSMDRVNLVTVTSTYSANTDISGLVTNNVLDFYPSWGAFSGLKKFSNFSGGDGDLWGCKFSFDTDISIGAKVKTFRFIIYIEDPADPSTRFIMFQQAIPIPKVITLFDGTYFHQQLNKDLQNTFNMPANEPLNRMKLEAIKPAKGVSPQNWIGEISFQTNWREWIENLNVDNSFYDSTKPNNNLNEKTSNYADGSPWLAYGVIEIGVLSNEQPTVPTIYELYSDGSTIVDFDSVSWAGFVGSTKYYDQSGDLTSNIDNEQNIRIEITFSHTLGTLLLADIDGFVWIERNDSTIKPWYLSTSKDWTNENNPLQPTDTLMTGNVQYVEVVSALNEVRFICQTNKENIESGFVYNVYGRLWNKK